MNHRPGGDFGRFRLWLGRQRGLNHGDNHSRAILWVSRLR